MKQKHIVKKARAARAPVLFRLVGAVTGVSDLMRLTRRSVHAAAAETSRAHAGTASLAQNLNQLPEVRRNETYERAVARLGLSNADLAASRRSYLNHARLATVATWLSFGILLGAVISLQLLWAINALASTLIFASVASRSWFCFLRIERRQFFSGARFLRADALRCLNVFSW